jgi:Acyl-CoA carboxylase epsilon subunit
MAYARYQDPLDGALVMTGDHEPATPALRIVRGEPTAEELAVVTALITASTDGARDSTVRPALPRGRWNDPGYGHRRYWPPGVNAWRAAR